jgi:hypothetical protein
VTSRASSGHYIFSGNLKDLYTTLSLDLLCQLL